MHSPVKAAGGKARLVPDLVKLIPPYVGTRPDRRYVEPFFGGGALFWALSEMRAGDGQSMPYATVNDANTPLMCAFMAIRMEVGTVVDSLRWHARKHAEMGRDHYYKQRDLLNLTLARVDDTEAGHSSARNIAILSMPEHAARFLYINKACFNGLWRVNRAGRMNVPANDLVLTPERAEETNAILDEPNLRACALALANTRLFSVDYTDAVRDVRAGDLVYFDPPYDGTFSAYTSEGFDADDHAALSAVARDLVKIGARVVISNSDTPLVRSLYAGDDFKIGTLPCMHSMAASGEKRKRVDELVIVGGAVKDWKQTELLL